MVVGVAWSFSRDLGGLVSCRIDDSSALRHDVAFVLMEFDDYSGEIASF